MDRLDILLAKPSGDNPLTKEFEFMSDAKPVISSGGMRGQSAGSTAICTVGKEGIGLTYRGYNIEDLGAVIPIDGR
jgi:citrate synthase